MVNLFEVKNNSRR